jgi:hypothetical protein
VGFTLRFLKKESTKIGAALFTGSNDSFSDHFDVFPPIPQTNLRETRPH